MFTTPMINIWNPICKRYQWLRTLNIFSISDTYKIYKNDVRAYVVVMNENNQCPCSKIKNSNTNNYLVVTDSQVFRHSTSHIPNNWINKQKVFPEPELGEKNPYTNKYMGIDMKELYFHIKNKYPRYIRFDEPNYDCCKNKNDNNDMK